MGDQYEEEINVLTQIQENLLRVMESFKKPCIKLIQHFCLSLVVADSTGFFVAFLPSHRSGTSKYLP